MYVYSLKFGLSAGSNQAMLIQELKANNADVIQTSDGLCVKSGLDKASITALVESKMSGVSIATLDPSAIAEDAQMSADVKAFVAD